MADITTIPEVRCVAMLSKTPINHATGRTLDRQWLYDAIDQLEAQDSNAAFRTKAIRVSEGRSRLLPAVDNCGSALNAVLLVDDSVVSRMAMKLGSHFVNKLTDR